MKNQIQPNDLIFAKSPTKSEKPLLLRVITLGNEVVQAALEEHRHETVRTMEIPRASILMNVGPDPYPGKVYGYDLSYLYRRHVEVDPLGEVAVFCRTSKETVSHLREAAANLERRFKKLGLLQLLQDKVQFEIVSKEYAGKWAGMYTRARKEGQSHKIQVTLDKSRLETSSINTYEYVLAHEFGHHLHYQYVKAHTPLDAAWIRAYQATVKPLAVPQDTVQSLLDALISERSVKGASGEIPEDWQPHFRRILREVRSSAGLGPRELDKLLEAQKDDDVKAAWPTSGLMLSEKHPSVTEYALKNYNELFAESFAFHVLGRELPKRIVKLMEASILRVDATV